MPYRQFTFTIASGATGTNLMKVGDHHHMMLVVSNMTSFNAGAGNASITIRGGLSETDTHADILSANISTHTAKGVYPFSVVGAPYMSLGFGTAVTGTAANTIDVVLYMDPTAS